MDQNVAWKAVVLLTAISASQCFPYHPFDYNYNYLSGNERQHFDHSNYYSEPRHSVGSASHYGVPQGSYADHQYFLIRSGMPHSVYPNQYRHGVQPPEQENVVDNPGYGSGNPVGYHHDYTHQPHSSYYQAPYYPGFYHSPGPSYNMFSPYPSAGYFDHVRPQYSSPQVYGGPSDYFLAMRPENRPKLVKKRLQEKQSNGEQEIMLAQERSHSRNVDVGGEFENLYAQPQSYEFVGNDEGVVIESMKKYQKGGDIGEEERKKTKEEEGVEVGEAAAGVYEEKALAGGGGGGGGGDKEDVVIEETSGESAPVGPSVAQAKPQAIAMAGPGGVAAASPVATAIVGPGGMAIAAPSATAVAGPTGGAPPVVSPANLAVSSAYKAQASAERKQQKVGGGVSFIF